MGIKCLGTRLVSISNSPEAEKGHKNSLERCLNLSREVEMEREKNYLTQ